MEINMTLEETLKLAATLLQAVSIAVTAGFAVAGLSAWRKQLVGKRKFDVAEEAMALFAKLRADIQYIRNPLSYRSEAAGFVKEAGIEVELTNQNTFYLVIRAKRNQSRPSEIS
jgi:hypothetical protein